MTLRDIAFVHKKRKVTREEKLAQAKVRIISASSPGSTQHIGSCFDNRAGSVDKNNDRSRPSERIEENKTSRIKIVKFTDEQCATINQSSAGRFDPRVFVNCLQAFVQVPCKFTSTL